LSSVADSRRCGVRPDENLVWRPSDQKAESSSISESAIHLLPEFGQATATSGDGNTTAVGSYFYDSANTQNIGRVHVYLRNGNSWTLFGGSIDGEVLNEDLGFSASLSVAAV
jgi:hypothetical protein